MFELLKLKQVFWAVFLVKRGINQFLMKYILIVFFVNEKKIYKKMFFKHFLTDHVKIWPEKKKVELLG